MEKRKKKIIKELKKYNNEEIKNLFVNYISGRKDRLAWSPFSRYQDGVLTVNKECMEKIIDIVNKTNQQYLIQMAFCNPRAANCLRFGYPILGFFEAFLEREKIKLEKGAYEGNINWRYIFESFVFIDSMGDDIYLNNFYLTEK